MSTRLQNTQWTVESSKDSTVLAGKLVEIKGDTVLMDGATTAWCTGLADDLSVANRVTGFHHGRVPITLEFFGDAPQRTLICDRLSSPPHRGPGHGDDGGSGHTAVGTWTAQEGNGAGAERGGGDRA